MSAMAATAEFLDAYARELGRDPLLTVAEAERDFAVRRRAFAAVNPARVNRPDRDRVVYSTDHDRPSRRALRVARTLSA